MGKSTHFLDLNGFSDCIMEVMQKGAGKFWDESRKIIEEAVDEQAARDDQVSLFPNVWCSNFVSRACEERALEMKPTLIL